jgi:hypothetical protein
MKMKSTKTLLAILLVITITFAISPAKAAGTPRIYVNPRDTVLPQTTSVGTKFNITIRIENAPTIGAFQINLWFNDSIINFTRIFEPTNDPQYIFYGKTTTLLPLPPDSPYTHYGPGQGALKPAVTLAPPPPDQTPSTGNGTAFIFEFNVTKGPPPLLSSVLNINQTDTYLMYDDGTTNYELPGVIKDNGTYTLVPEFPSVLGLSVLLTVATAVIVLLRRRRVQKI